jgi:hypothetical protein
VNENYDCTEEVTKHRKQVEWWMYGFAQVLIGRSKHHDKSKLEAPEKQTFDVFTPKLKTLTFGSAEYKAALVEMGAGLKHHYENNRHHPEHYPEGIAGMTLHDVVEMLCDWMAAAGAKGNPVDLDMLGKRFDICPQLIQIFENTLREEDFYNQVNGVPLPYVSAKGPSIPENMRPKPEDEAAG